MKTGLTTSGNISVSQNLDQLKTSKKLKLACRSEEQTAVVVGIVS